MNADNSDRVVRPAVVWISSGDQPGQASVHLRLHRPIIHHFSVHRDDPFGCAPFSMARNSFSRAARDIPALT
ncbi:hypothetical protein EYF80_020330 [Liparis tanakae]|uniref:Uncharacterized protein n=1 Tax=Liparis tanakae TaxID=230148 RepID=A0A4Z2HUG2_9TELE|nr:hypothetical protein EYF80_020330 [Liparis tanakae]